MRNRQCRKVLVLFLLAAFTPLAAQTVQPVTTLDAVSGFQPLPNGIEVRAGSAVLRITAVRDDILRMRIAPDAKLPEDASWAVIPASRTASVEVQPAQDATSVGFKTKALDLRVEKNPLRIVLRDLEGNVICADAPGRSAALFPSPAARGHLSLSPRERAG